MDILTFFDIYLNHLSPLQGYFYLCNFIFDNRITKTLENRDTMEEIITKDLKWATIVEILTKDSNRVTMEEIRIH